MARERKKPDLFQYLDYRRFLTDWYQDAKQQRGSFSFRAFSRRAGFSSPNFLKLVMGGARNLTERSLEKFVAGLGLNKEESEFFRNLVFFNQAAPPEKDIYYKRLLQSRKYKLLKPMEKSSYDFYSHWLHPVVREMITHKDFDGQPAWIASHLSLPIPPAEIERSLGLLAKLGLIEKNAMGRWQPTDTLITTGPEVSSLIVMNYHKRLLEVSSRMLDAVPAPDRDVSAMTLGVSKQTLQEIKKKIQAFRAEILKMVALEEYPEEVVQLNFQMFPWMKREHSDEK